MLSNADSLGRKFVSTQSSYLDLGPDLGLAPDLGLTSDQVAFSKCFNHTAHSFLATYKTWTNKDQEDVINNPVFHLRKVPALTFQNPIDAHHRFYRCSKTLHTLFTHSVFYCGHSHIDNILLQAFWKFLHIMGFLRFKQNKAFVSRFVKTWLRAGESLRVTVIVWFFGTRLRSVIRLPPEHRDAA